MQAPSSQLPLILASQSPRRQQLLTWAEVPFEVRVSDADESFDVNMPINDVPVYIARNKALAILQQGTNERVILAADTIVVLEQLIIGKPQNREHAIEILTQLSGKTHRVITGVIILHQGKEITFADTTEVTFHALTPQQIIFYVDKYQPYDKAGAYAIQEWIGVVGISNVRGDFYNVMGLPVSRVVQELQKASLL